MARRTRPQHAALWHLMNRGVEKRSIFIDDQDRACFLKILEQVVERHEWKLDSYTLMPNHYHLGGDCPEDSVSRGLHLLDGTYAAAFNRRWDRVGHLFQGRATGVLVEREAHYAELDRYLVLNAVRAGIVRDPADYKWSSYRATVGLEPCPPWLSIDGILDRYSGHEGGPQAGYAEHVAAGMGAPSPWDGVVGRLCLGSEKFVHEVSRAVGLDSSRAFAVQEEIERRGAPPIDLVLAAVLVVFSASLEGLRGARSGTASEVLAHLALSRSKATLSQIARMLAVSVATAHRRARAGCEVARRGDVRLAAVERLIEEMRSEKPDPVVLPREANRESEK